MDKGDVYDFSGAGIQGTACASMKAPRVENLQTFKAGGAQVLVKSPDGVVTATQTFGHLYPGAQPSGGGGSGCGTCFLVKSLNNNACTNFQTKYLLVMGTDTCTRSSPEIGRTEWQEVLDAYGGQGCIDTGARWYFDYMYYHDEEIGCTITAGPEGGNCA